MHRVDVEVVVCGLIVNVALDFVGLDLAGEDVRGGRDDLVADFLEPGDVILLQVPHGPDVAPLDQREEVHPLHRLAVPIEVRQEEEARVRRRVPVAAGDDIFLLGAALEDVEDPV